jgi:hypothetical protein
MLKQTFIGLISLLAAGAVLAQAYKWVDEDGVVHFSDRPREGAEEVELPEAPRRPPPPPPTTRQAAAGQAAGEAAPEEQPFRYESLTIGSPLAEETLWNIEGVLNVQLNLQPALQSGHRIRVYFDGEPRMVNRTSFQIDEVYRGVHNIQAEVIDEAGTLMIRSMPNRFYVQQNTIVRPPR